MSLMRCAQFRDSVRGIALRAQRAYWLGEHGCVPKDCFDLEFASVDSVDVGFLRSYEGLRTRDLLRDRFLHATSQTDSKILSYFRHVHPCDAVLCGPWRLLCGKPYD